MLSPRYPIGASGHGPGVTASEGHGSGGAGSGMVFHQDTHDTLLFSAWTTNSALSYFFAWLLVFCFTLGYYRLQAARATTLVPALNRRIARTTGSGRRHLLHAARAGIYALESAMGFVVMLFVMTFNVGWCLAVVLASFTNRFVFDRGAAEEDGRQQQQRSERRKRGRSDTMETDTDVDGVFLVHNDEDDEEQLALQPAPRTLNYAPPHRNPAHASVAPGKAPSPPGTPIP